MTPFTALAALLLPLASAVPCVQFDSTWALYAFGGSQDVKLGSVGSLAQPSATPLTTTGRPPWTGNNTQCLFSQFNNAMYVIGGDSSDLSKIYVFNFGSSSWSTQSTSSVPSSLGNSRSSSVLDHDTNVVFTLSGNTLYQLDMSSITTTASSSALAWESVNNPSFGTSGYSVVAAQASNHINYFGVPGTAAGSANIFVVHYAYFQPAAQSYPTRNGGATFPDSAGQAISIPANGDSAPSQMVYIPNDFSQTYVVSHWTNPSSYNDTSGAPYATNLINSTQTLPPPTSKDAQAAYAASPSAIVQIDTAGNIYYMNNAVGTDFTVQSSASWQKAGYTLAGSGGSGGSTASASASASSSGSAASSSRGASSTSSGTGSSASSASGTASAAASSTSRAAGWKNDGVKQMGWLAAGLGAAVAALF